MSTDDPNTKMALLVDDEIYQEAQRTHQLIDTLGTYLSNFHWQLYATPSFKFPVNLYRAKSTVEAWVGDFGSQTYAYAAYEQGRAGGRTHAHVLLGGLVGKIAKAHAGRLWKHGNIVIAPYDPRRGACWYVAKFPNDGDFIGNPQRVRRRGRGKKRQKGQ